jgi:hypothetical protein
VITTDLTAQLRPRLLGPRSPRPRLLRPRGPRPRLLRPRGVRNAVAVVALSAALAAAALPAASAASARPARPPAASWQVVQNLRARQVTAFAPVSSTSAWLFEQQNVASAWLLHGSALTRVAFPAEHGESMMGAAAAGPDNVWAISQHRVFAWNGSSWRAMRTFGTSFLFSVLPLSGHSVLVFGAGQTWHYNGTTWSVERSGKGLVSASALSATSVWAVSNGSDVAHWDGRTWTKTSLARLLPRSPYLCHYGLTGVDAISARNVWVLASGNCQDSGGPLRLLHYNGHWAKAPLTRTYGTARGVAADGSRLWLAISGGAGGNSSFFRYSAGTMTAVPLPVRHEPAILLAGPFATRGAHPATYLLATTFTAAYTHPTTYLLRYGD